MMMRTKAMGVKLPSPPPNSGGGTGGGDRSSEGEWEVRPGGMLVQKRTDSDQNRPPPPTVMVRVKYGNTYHEVHISCQATFGELKKMLTGPTGLHHDDQKLLFKNKERDSKAFLDISGVKNKSKIVLIEDPLSQERKFIEMKKHANMEKAATSISGISLEIDRLGGQVSALESIISKGGKIEEKSITNTIELLMNQMLKLDAITAVGDVKLQRKMQVKRVQKYVETLDVLKIKNSALDNNNNVSNNSKQSSSVQHNPQPQVKQSRRSASGSVVITTQWETFDAIQMTTPPSSAAAAAAAGQSSSSKSTAAVSSTGSPQPKFNWDLL